MAKAAQYSGKNHVLLGNGFSIGAHSQFKYGSLYEQAVNSGLSEQITELFSRYGTANFEEVLRQLDEGRWMADLYRLRKSDRSPDMKADYEQLKQALVESIAMNHPEDRGSVEEELLLGASVFLAQFDNVFITNYDLLLYWTSLYDDPFLFEDGFGREIDTEDDYRVFLPTGSSNKQVFFLHGALHLYVEDGEVRKRVWNTTEISLMEQVKEALGNRQFPLIVSEGTSNNKMKHIEASSYLSNCARRFENIQGTLFVYGCSLSEQDDHIRKWIETNTGIERLFVGVNGDQSAGANVKLITRAQQLVERRHSVLESRYTGRRYKKKPLDIFFFQSESANVWTASAHGNA